MFREKLSSAHEIFTEKGAIALVAAISRVILPTTLYNWGLLLFNEGVIAYPTRDGNWLLFSPLTLRRKRKIPNISETLSGIHLGSDRHKQMLSEMYSYEGFVEVEKGDVVVDVGAYIGTFSLVATKKAKKVVAIDPFASINNVLYDNVSDYSNISIVPKAAWKCEDVVELNTSTRPSKNTLLTPKMGTNTTSYNVAANTVPELVACEGITHIDFLKVEAEGVEIEIIEGVLNDEIDVGKIAVDAGPERYGESVQKDIVQMLESSGYECRVKSEAPWWGDEIVFARRVYEAE
ncbi:FkbM family methyltransferase [Halapricum salinum]|uniref:FkbM family methyltransferase n=1 Tax=Halapricum salinum TaxID=1457250 RepID=A0A4D6HCR2_9EURY|nr:FkbM family methyltransferase [Halapricum salinum]QCC51769.1 FkbM family methyltransferase [Halapricum salinum]